MSLQDQIEQLAARETGNYSDADFARFDEFKASLNRGEIRAAERDAAGKWQANAWVKRGILLGFRMGLIIEMTPAGAPLQFLDKNTYPIQNSRRKIECALFRVARAFATARTSRRALSACRPCS